MSDTLTRLSRVLGMLGSQFDGEVLNAARMAEKLRVELDKPWSALISTKPTDDHSTRQGFSNLLIRTLEAERRAITAETKAQEFESRVRKLETEIAAMRDRPSPPSSSGGRRSKGSSYSTDLNPAVEQRLVEALQSGWRSARWVHHCTLWERPMNLRIRLARIADKHGLRLECPIRGHYTFCTKF